MPARSRAPSRPIRVLRFYAAVKDGIVVGARSTWRRYTHVVLHTNIHGTFATFHTSPSDAQEARQFFESHPIKIIARPFETRRRLAIGEPFDLAGVLRSGESEADRDYRARTASSPHAPDAELTSNGPSRDTAHAAPAWTTN